jgi:hypothetical protein
MWQQRQPVVAVHICVHLRFDTVVLAVVSANLNTNRRFLEMAVTAAPASLTIAPTGI